MSAMPLGPMGMSAQGSTARNIAGHMLAMSVIPGMAAVILSVVAVVISQLAVLHLALGIGLGGMVIAVVSMGQGRRRQHPGQHHAGGAHGQAVL